MKKPRAITWAVVSAGIVGSLLLAGCAPTSTGADPAGSGEPQSGGELVHAVTDLLDGWQQQQSNNWYKSQVWTQLVETLVYVDEEGTVYPWLADSWEESADGLSYTFQIRDGVSFSDGTPLTAETVAHNLNVLGLGDKEKGISRSPLIPGDFAGAEATGDLEVVVTLSAPNRGFIPSLGFFAAGILSDETLDLPLEQQSDLANVVGTGPFVFEEQTPGKEIVVVKRDDYDWPTPAFEHTGAAYLDRIIFTVVADDGSRLGALESNQIDSLHFVQPSEELRLQDAGYNVIYGQYLGTPINFVLRPGAAIVSDERVRQALQIGIDRQDIVDTVYNKNWKAATSSVQQAVPGWTDLSDELAYDPDGAEALLDAAGWSEKNSDGIRVKDGQTLTLPGYSSPYLNTSPQILELIAQQLKLIGIEFALQQTDIASYTDVQGNAQTPLVVTANTFLDATSLRQYWGKTFSNQFKLTTDELEPLLADVTHTANGTPERTEAAAALQKATIEGAYTIPLVDNYQVLVTSPAVHDVVTNGVGRPYFYGTWKD
jgi:peptide/nickel transport system substrate-binding protein